MATNSIIVENSIKSIEPILVFDLLIFIKILLIITAEADKSYPNVTIANTPSFLKLEISTAMRLDEAVLNYRDKNPNKHNITVTIQNIETTLVSCQPESSK